MPKIIIYLQDKEFTALHKLAQSEYRQPKAQAAVIIRNELQRLGMVAGGASKRDESASLKETGQGLIAGQTALAEACTLSAEA